MSEPIDNELGDLLKQLNAIDEEIVVEESKSEERPVQSIVVDSLEASPAVCPVNPSLDSIPNLIPDQPSSTNSIDIAKYLEKLDIVTDKVLTACDNDRQEAQDVIDYFRDKIKDPANVGPPSRMYVDGLVQTIEVKAGINMTAVKIIEATAKMLAATKASVNINNMNGTVVNNHELNELLERPLESSDEY